jgi:hypothetical protein
MRSCDWHAQRERGDLKGKINCSRHTRMVNCVGLNLDAQAQRRASRGVKRPLRRTTMAHDDSFARSSCLFGRSHTCKQAIEGKGEVEQFDSPWLSRWRSMQHRTNAGANQAKGSQASQPDQPAQVTDQPEARVGESPVKLHHQDGAGAASRSFGR